MANRTRTQLSTDSLGLFPDNTSQLITPQDLRDWITNGIESFVTQKDTSRFQNAFYENKGNNITAASTTNLSSATGNFVHIQGTTTITSFGTLEPGARFILMFENAANIQASANLIIPGTASGNIRVATPGDCCLIVSEGGGAWRIVGYFVAGGAGAGTITGVTAGTGLSGGGTSAVVTVNLANTGVTPAAYTNANITIDAQGRITAASNGSGGGGSVTAVTASAPLSSSGGTAPDISIPMANATTDGYLDKDDFVDFAGKQDALSAGTGISIVSNTINNTGVTSVSGTGSVNGITLTGTVTNTGNLTLGGTLSNVNLGSQVTGTLPIANGGTGTTTPSLVAGSNVIITGSWPNQTIAASGGGGGSGTVNSGNLNRLAYYSTNPTGTAVSELPTAGSSGQILQSNGTGSAPSWVTAPAATLTLGTSIVGGATAGRLLLTTTSGANQVLNQDTLLNYDTTNDRLGIGVASPTGTLHLAAGVAANPQVLLVPSAITPTGTTNGSIWCNTVSSNTSLQFYKDSSLTRVITLDRNPDLATGTSSGVIVADTSGNLTKSADLTALGIYAETAGTTVQNTTTATTIIGTVVGSTTLPANFFGVGKTIRIFASGTYQQTSGSNTCTILLTIGGVSMGSIALQHGNSVGPIYWEAEWNLTCRTSGATGSVQYTSKGILNTTSPTFYFNSALTSGSINTTTSNSLSINATWSAANANNILVTSIHYANYIN